MNTQIYTAQTNLINSLAAFLNSEAIRLAPESATIGAACYRMALLLVEYGALTPANAENYTERDAAMHIINESYAALAQVIMQGRLQSLQYNGIEIDTELIRIFLFGQNLVAMPNP